MRHLLFFTVLVFSLPAFSQRSGLTFTLPGDSNLWIRATGAVQVWARYTDHNPGSAVAFGPTSYSSPPAFDIGIRRARFQLFGPVARRTFFYAQFGMNNFNANSPRKAGAFFHDLIAEYTLVRRALSAGGGLTGWSGLSRYASPSIVSTLMYDAPLFQQATNDVNEQFLRKLSLYAKGKISRLDYRVALSKPMPIQTAVPSIDTTLGDLAFRSVFSPALPQLQYQAYLNWQFLDEEQNLTPYTVGSYLGTKNVLTLGAGIIYQPEAMRHQNLQRELIHTPMRLMAIDLFMDRVLNAERRTAITAYLGLFDFDFGPNHIRTLGVMNPVNSSLRGNVNTYSGAGNAYAMFGTGNLLHLQTGYKMRDDLFGGAGTLQPYADLVFGQYRAFIDPLVVWNAGINWLIQGNASRISVNYQERPVFVMNASLKGDEMKGARRGMVVLQYQASF